MANNAVRLAAVAVASVVAFAAALPRSKPLPPSTTLLQTFPELADLNDATGVAIGIKWVGLSRLSPYKADYVLELHGDRFEGPAVFQVADAPVVKRAAAIPRDVVRAFLTAAGKVAMVDADYRPYIDHTDDYPSLEIEVPTRQGALRVHSYSQQRRVSSGDYLDRTPWQIVYPFHSFVVTANDLDRAYAPFEPYLQDKKILHELAEDYSRKR